MFNYLKHLLKFLINVTLGTMVATTIVVITCVLGLTVFIGVILSLDLPSSEIGSNWETVFGKDDAKYRFVSLPITGLIVGDESDIGDQLGLFQQSITRGYEVKETLYELAQDDAVSGVILDINSPGGTIYGANAIAEGVAYYKKQTKKPVISFVSGMAASGAYWAAVSADHIVADIGTSVGSIGVISGPFQFYDTVLAQNEGIFSGGVVTQKGIESIYISAGSSKDLGNPYRRMTKTEIASLQTMVNNEYETFVTYVSKQRNISTETITSTFGAFLFDTKSALSNKLIDSVGSRESAYAHLAMAAGIENEDYSVEKKFTKKGMLQNLLESKNPSNPLRIKGSACNLTSVHLVYHGDIASLCP